jgi:hypothetical protein
MPGLPDLLRGERPEREAMIVSGSKWFRIKKYFSPIKKSLFCLGPRIPPYDLPAYATADVTPVTGSP